MHVVTPADHYSPPKFTDMKEYRLPNGFILRAHVSVDSYQSNEQDDFESDVYWEKIREDIAKICAHIRETGPEYVEEEEVNGNIEPFLNLNLPKKISVKVVYLDKRETTSFDMGAQVHHLTSFIKNQFGIDVVNGEVKCHNETLDLSSPSALLTTVRPSLNGSLLTIQLGEPKEGHVGVNTKTNAKKKRSSTQSYTIRKILSHRRICEGVYEFEVTSDLYPCPQWKKYEEVRDTVAYEEYKKAGKLKRKRKDSDDDSDYYYQGGDGGDGGDGKSFITIPNGNGSYLVQRK